METPAKKLFRCAIYTRKSTEHNLDLEFNSLDAQREACEAYIKSQAHEGWRLVPHYYDDGAFSGASLDRPALQALLAEVRAGKIDIIVVYKVDRLTRSLADFAKLVELFDRHSVSFVSVTQSFNTISSLHRYRPANRCRSASPSIRRAAWDASPSTCCSRLRSSSAR
jgi:DNA invertase Pin-like site-specific DNA recombinase